MSYIRTKMINGNGPYYYEVRSERDGDTVRQVHIQYLGTTAPVRGAGGEWEATSEIGAEPVVPNIPVPEWQPAVSAPHDFPGREEGGHVSKVQKVPIELIVPTEEKTEPAQVARFVQQFKEDPSQVPPLVVSFSSESTDDYDKLDLLDGHHRLEAARQLGIKSVPVQVYVSPDDWESVRESGGLQVRVPAEPVVPKRRFIPSAVPLTSPSGRMSKRARKAANERFDKELGIREVNAQMRAEANRPESDTQRKERLHRTAQELRSLADRGMKPRAYRKKADELDAEAERSA